MPLPIVVPAIFPTIANLRNNIIILNNDKYIMRNTIRLYSPWKTNKKKEKKVCKSLVVHWYKHNSE